MSPQRRIRGHKGTGNGAKTSANRRNALRSTGPRTPAGKARSSKNALRHGLLAGEVVLPDVEKAEEWEDHRDATFEDLDPVGRVEEVLVERVAAQSWRLGRVVRYEREAAAVGLEAAEEDSLARLRFTHEVPEEGDSIEAVTIRAELAEETARTLVMLADSSTPATKRLSTDATESALLVVQEALAGAEVTWEDAADAAFQELGGGSWTVKLARRTVDLMAERSGAAVTDEEKLLWSAALEAAREGGTKVRVARELTRDLDRTRRSRLLPDEKLLEKVVRYEAHLERSLFRTLHELERRQTARTGGLVSAPAALDVTVDAGERA